MFFLSGVLNVILCHMRNDYLLYKNLTFNIIKAFLLELFIKEKLTAWS